jgi:hypothetical protein
VANKISSINPKLFNVVPPAEKLSISKPAKPIKTPKIFFDSIFALNKRIAITITNKGVSEFKMPARELSTFFSIAIAKRKAGKKFPRKPESMTKGILLRGISLI